MKKLKRLLAVLVVLNILTLGLTSYNQFNLGRELSEIHNKISIHLSNYIPVDLRGSDRIIESNLLMKNQLRQRYGSGTHIKINGKSYVLTCAHITEQDGDTVVAITDEDKNLDLDLYKINRSLDLALYKIKSAYDGAHLYIANKNQLPKQGSNVITIGNPARWRNTITEGVVSKIRDIEYLVTNSVYFGSSGGALIYRGKVVGVIVQMKFNNHRGVPHHFGSAVNYEGLRMFLEGLT